MNTKGTALGKVVASVGAVALTFAGLLGGATIAQAAPQVGPDQPDHPKSGSLTIHKYVGAEGGRGDGTEQVIEGKDPLAGAKFTIWQLGKKDGDTCKALDLSTYEAWTDLPESAPKTIEEVEKTFCLVNANGTAQTTDTNGEAKFSDLALGFYYVQETEAPANIVSKTAPFYVSIPLPHETENWIYAVHAYPKNQKGDAPKKEINADKGQSDNGVTVGSVVEWTITQVVPALNAGEKYTSASIWDYLPDSLEYAETTDVSYDGTKLADTDYTLVQNGQNLTWELTDTGLGKLQAGKTITVKFKTKVLKVTETGDIENPGSDDPETPGYGSEFNGNKIPGDPTPHTYWGQLQVTKVDNSTPVNKLAGAQFKVFDNFADGACPAAAPAEGAVATGTSNAQGIVQWENVEPDNPLGLWVANSKDGPLADPFKTYCLYETKVPAGYAADQSGKAVTIKPGTTLTKDVNDLTVVNTKKEGPNLPLTGAGGTLLLSIIGVGLAAAGVTLAVVSRRKRQN